MAKQWVVSVAKAENTKTRRAEVNVKIVATPANDPTIPRLHVKNQITLSKKTVKVMVRNISTIQHKTEQLTNALHVQMVHIASNRLCKNQNKTL